MADTTSHRTGDPHAAAPRGRTARWVRPLGWIGLVVGFLLLVEALSKLTASSGQTAPARTLEIVLAIASVTLIAQSAGGLRPGRRHHTPQH